MLRFGFLIISGTYSEIYFSISPNQFGISFLADHRILKFIEHVHWRNQERWRGENQNLIDIYFLLCNKYLVFEGDKCVSHNYILDISALPGARGQKTNMFC